MSHSRIGSGRVSWSRIVLAGIAANVTTLVALGLLFGNPLVEPILYTQQAGQSPKVLSMFFTEPLPVVTPFWDAALQVSPRKLAVQGMLLVWSLALVVVFAVVWEPRRGPWWRKGLEFGVAAWAMLFLFFEAFIPFNMLGEPIRLVALELALQLAAMVLTGLVIAVVYRPASSFQG